MMKRVTILSALIGFAVCVASVAALPVPARASHFTNWLDIYAPFSGYWNKSICPDPSDPYSPQCAAPQDHHILWYGDWSTDFYQWPGAAGAFRIGNSNGGTAYGSVASRGSSCMGSTWAGYAYTINVYDGSGQRGFYVLAHVADSDGFGTSYVLSPGAAIYNGGLVGWTAYWGTSSCYNVSNFDGVHWHVEMGQPVHYACWHPWASGSSVSTADTLGAVGSNALTGRATCW
jgi:hypothetical protein